MFRYFQACAIPLSESFIIEYVQYFPVYLMIAEINENYKEYFIYMIKISNVVLWSSPTYLGNQRGTPLQSSSNGGGGFERSLGGAVGLGLLDLQTWLGDPRNHMHIFIYTHGTWWKKCGFVFHCQVWFPETKTAHNLAYFILYMYIYIWKTAIQQPNDPI